VPEIETIAPDIGSLLSAFLIKPDTDPRSGCSAMLLVAVAPPVTVADELPGL
jgi:hypothetical protein